MGIDKFAIAKGYNKILKWLLLASTLITVICMLVPIFHMKFLVNVSEMGIKYIGLKFTSGPIKEMLSVDSVFLDDLTLRETFAWKIVLRLLLNFMILWVVTGFCTFLPQNPKLKRVINENRYILETQSCSSGIYLQFWTCTIYVAIAQFLCFYLFNDWHFKGVKTLSIIPWIFHLAVYIACKLIINHRDSAFRGEVEPLCRAGGHAAFESRQSAPAPQNTENDKVELLIKYKELFDQGIITEEEYNQKKKELL